MGGVLFGQGPPHVVVLSSPLNGCLLLEQQIHLAGDLEQACRSTLVVAGQCLVRGIVFGEAPTCCCPQQPSQWWSAAGTASTSGWQS